MPSANQHQPPRTTIALRQETKARLDQLRAPGQCYDGFISQLVDLWESKRTPAPAAHRRP